MKTILINVLTLLIIIMAVNSGNSVPTYTLIAKNFARPDAKTITFDIYLKHTNSPPSFQYIVGQYFFNFNPAIANGGTLSYTIVSSDLPAILQPRNPQVFGSQLRLVGNRITPSSIFYISAGGSGTKIVKMKIMTTASSLAAVPLGLAWRNPTVPEIPPVTKIFALSGGVYVDITTPATHTIVGGLSEIAKDFEISDQLGNISSSISKNDVTLKWTIADDKKVNRFEIERKNSGTSDWIKIGEAANDENNHQFSYTDKLSSSGNYNYRVKQIDHKGNYEYLELSGQVEIESAVPTEFNLSQNFPNPFNPSTTIKFAIPVSSLVRLRVFDITGREISSVINAELTAGTYEYQWNASGFASGIYFYRLEADNFSQIRKMTLLK